MTGARNVISGNSQAGIEISGVLSTANQVAGNFIGTNSTGTGFAVTNPTAPDVPIGIKKQIPAQNVGVLLNGASGNLVGGTSAGSEMSFR
jgi:hypothetical protein